MLSRFKLREIAFNVKNYVATVNVSFCCVNEIWLKTLMQPH